MFDGRVGAHRRLWGRPGVRGRPADVLVVGACEDNAGDSNRSMRAARHPRCGKRNAPARRPLCGASVVCMPNHSQDGTLATCSCVCVCVAFVHRLASKAYRWRSWFGGCGEAWIDREGPAGEGSSPWAPKLSMCIGNPSLPAFVGQSIGSVPLVGWLARARAFSRPNLECDWFHAQEMASRMGGRALEGFSLWLAERSSMRMSCNAVSLLP